MDIYLDGTWSFAVDDTRIGLTDEWYSPQWVRNHYTSCQTIEVPSNFNSQRGLESYIGDVWYFKKIPELPFRPKSHEYSLEFEGVNYHAQVWLNGYYLGENFGGYLPFRFYYNPRLISLTGDNYLVVKVSNQINSNFIPGSVFKWHNWGGIHRSVKLLLLEKTRVTKIKVTTSIPPLETKSAIIQVDYVIKNPQEFLDRCYAMQIEPQVEWELYYLGRFFNGEQQFNEILLQTGVLDVNPATLQQLPHISHDIDSLKEYFNPVFDEIEKIEEPIDLETFFSRNTERKGSRYERGESPTKKKTEDISEDHEIQNSVKILLHNPSLWTPDTPELYSIRLHLNGIDEDKEIRFGIRQIETKDRFVYLNRSPILLKGVGLHEEFLEYGNHYPYEMRRKELINIKSLGLNTIYTHHFPHDEKLLQYADEEGLFVIEEIPLNWSSNFKNQNIFVLGKKMVKELVKRDYNHPCVIFWSLGSDISSFYYPAQQFLKYLITIIRELDSTRLISYSNQQFTFDPLKGICDVKFLNLHHSWKYPTTKQLQFLIDLITPFHKRIPLIVNSFGAEGKIIKKGNHNQYSETFQTRRILAQTKIINSLPTVSGWILNTFRDYKIPVASKKDHNKFSRYGLYDEENVPKNIVSLLPKFINSKIKIVPYNHIWSPFVYFMLAIFEICELLFSFLKKSHQKRRIGRYYSKIPKN